MFDHVGRMFFDKHPLFKSIPIEAVAFQRGEVIFRSTLPFQFDENGLSHNGVLTILLDTILSIASWSIMDSFDSQATISLRTDFYRQAPTGAQIDIQATSDEIVDNVALCRGRATDQNGVIIADASATFMVSAVGLPKGITP